MFGYLNSSLYASEINYVAMPSGQESYWLIRMDQVAVNGTNVTSWAQGAGQMAAIDTGTTLIGGPRDVIANIYAQVPGARAATGAYTGESTSWRCCAGGGPVTGRALVLNVPVLELTPSFSISRLLLVPLLGQRFRCPRIWCRGTFVSPPASSLTQPTLTRQRPPPAQNYNMSTADFNLGPFGIDSRTNQSTCLGAFFDLAFSSSSRISWVVSQLSSRPSSK